MSLSSNIVFYHSSSVCEEESKVFIATTSSAKQVRCEGMCSGVHERSGVGRDKGAVTAVTAYAMSGIIIHVKHW